MRPGARSARGPGASTAVLGVGAFAAVILAVGGTGWFLYGRSDPGPVAAAGAQVDTRSPQPGSSPAPSSSISYPTTTADAGTSLASEAEADRMSVASLEGLWVPQLSSKAVGMVADGITYDEDAIARHVASLRGQYPEALLLSSSDYASFRTPGMWIVIVERGYRTAAEANSWCDRMRIDRDDCFAKRLAQDGPSGNTEPR